MIRPLFSLLSLFFVLSLSAQPYIAHGNLYLRHGDVLMAYHIAVD